MRADDPQEFVARARRLARLLAGEFGAGPHPFLVESFIPGVEVALEGMLDGGELVVLALFDKPDPLDGPFFEETIYTTPSRLPGEVQAAIARCAGQAAAAIGLQTGPIHAELRVNEQGPWLLEIAGRSIGGLCGRTLRFEYGGAAMSLEELIVRQACGLPWRASSPGAGSITRASGVMMIPIPEAGQLRGVAGVPEAAGGAGDRGGGDQRGAASHRHAAARGRVVPGVYLCPAGRRRRRSRPRCGRRTGSCGLRSCRRSSSAWGRSPHRR